MKKYIYMAGVAFAAMAISSCDENTDTIGQSLTSNEDQLNLSSLSYNVATRTVTVDSVFTQSSTCYLGLVRDPDTQTDVKSEFATQFHLLDITTIPDPDMFISLTDDMPSADSCDLILYVSNPFDKADTLSSIKMTVHELAKTMEPGTYYSNFNPISRGMVRADGINKKKMFAFRNTLDSDSLRSSSSYLDNIRISLNEPYTDKNGVSYNNYGTYLIRQYHEHPEYYKNSYAFSHRVCPGFFFEINDGYGFHAKVSNVGLKVYYRAQGDTSIVNTGITLAGTREVMQTTLVTNNKQAIKKLAAETRHTYLKTPAGLFTEVTLPVKEIKEAHQNDSIIAAKISFQRLNDESSDARMFGIPQTLLMVQEDSLITFFEGNNVPNLYTSYYADFNYISTNYSATNTYNFTNISNLISFMWDQYQEGIKADKTWEQKHPDWNKVLLVPITYTSGSSTNAEHDMSLSSTRLVGGADNPYDPVKIEIVFARFSK